MGIEPKGRGPGIADQLGKTSRRRFPPPHFDSHHLNMSDSLVPETRVLAVASHVSAVGPAAAVFV